MILKTKRKDKRRNILIGEVITVLIVLLYFGNILIDINKKKKLKADWVLTQGQLVSVKLRGKSADFVEFQYMVDNTVYYSCYYKETQKLFMEFDSIKLLKWPVIYERTDYSNSALLLLRKDYDYWGVPYNGQRVIEIE